MSKKKNKKMNPAQLEAIRTKDFFDCILPGAVRFMSDYYIVGDSYRSVWVVREYPPSTEEQAILSQLADRSGVTLRIYHRLVEPKIYPSIKFKEGNHEENLCDPVISYSPNREPVRCHLSIPHQAADPLLRRAMWIIQWVVIIAGGIVLLTEVFGIL